MSITRACEQCGAKNRLAPGRLADTARCGACRAAIGPLHQPLAVNDTKQFDEILSGTAVPILVDFWAEWCGPCRMAAPLVAKVAQEMAGKAVVLKVDTEQNQQLAARYQVRGIPNFAVFSAGKLVHQQPGLVDGEQMIRWLQSAGAEGR